MVGSKRSGTLFQAAFPNSFKTLVFAIVTCGTLLSSLLPPRLVILLTTMSGSLVSPTTRLQAASVPLVTATPCKTVGSLIKSGAIRQHYLDLEDDPNSDRASNYKKLDIDGDGTVDKVRVSSGSSGSFLQIQLSSGRKMELEAGFMTLLELEGRVYALATYWEGQNLLGRQLYIVTKDSVRLVCDTAALKQ